MRAFARCLSGYGFRCVHCSSSSRSCACRRCTLREARRRWNAAPRSPILPRCANSIVAGLAWRGCWLHPKPPAARSTTALCSRCRRWRRSARRSTPNSSDTLRQHKAELPNETIGVGTQFDFQLFDRDAALFASPPLRAGRHRQPDGPRLCVPQRLRRNQADLSPDARWMRPRSATTAPRRGCR